MASLKRSATTSIITIIAAAYLYNIVFGGLENRFALPNIDYLTSTGEWSAEQERIKALSGRDDDLFDQSLLTDGIEEDRAVNE